MNKRHSFPEIDVFSLGVILFLMVTSEMPYRTVASLEDPYYSQLVSDQPERFWRRFDNVEQTHD